MIILYLLHILISNTSELEKARMASFVIGPFILFGQYQVVFFFLTFISFFVKLNVTAYEFLSRSYLGLSAFAIILIISGVVMFCLGDKQRDRTTLT